LFQTNNIPKREEGFLLNKCFDYAKNPNEAIAIRSFAITIIYTISKPYPELLNELLIVLQHINQTDTSPGIKSKVTHTLKAIHQLLQKNK
jgi:hypothetical protein